MDGKDCLRRKGKTLLGIVNKHLPADTLPADTLPADTLPADTLPADTADGRNCPQTPRGIKQRRF